MKHNALRPAKKRFSQNFLTDQNIVRKIIASLNLQKHDRVVEIGPGRGVLTEELVKLTDRLEVIEIDRDLTSLLREKYQDKITVHQADVLKFDFSSMAGQAPIRVIGNLPYHISTPLLFRLFEYNDLIKDMFFMLQLEVVDRLCAEVSTKSYGRLSIMGNYHSHPRKLFTVPPSAFTPQPKVTSAFLQLDSKKSSHKKGDALLLNKLVTNAFSKRRKTLRNALAPFLTDEDYLHLEINPQSRPENLSLSDYLRCAAHVKERETRTP